MRRKAGDPVEHGGWQGYWAHRKAGEPMCEVCGPWYLEYRRDYRARMGKGLNAEKRAARRAIAELRAAHDQEYQARYRRAYYREIRSARSEEGPSRQPG